MKIPAFKTSSHFLGDTDLPCLVAKVKNSKLPGVAFRHISEFKDDSTCEIYLRGKNSKKISAWQQNILEQLFEKTGLAAAIEEAMKQYEKISHGYSDMTKKEQREFQKIGIAPFMTVSLIVIDDIKKEAILNARTEWDGNLIEHGISIYLRKGHWHFDDADYLINYRFPFGSKYADRKEKFEFKQRQQKWETMFPPPSPKTLVETDGSILYGRWELDERQTNELLKQLGDEAFTGIGQFHEISKSKLESFLRIAEKHIIGFERRGNWIKIIEEIQSPEFLKGKNTTEFWCDGKILVEAGGLVFRRRGVVKKSRR